MTLARLELPSFRGQTREQIPVVALLLLRVLRGSFVRRGRIMMDGCLCLLLPSACHISQLATTPRLV